VVPYRDADDIRFLKLTGDLGVIVPMVRLDLSFIHVPDFSTLGIRPSKRDSDIRTRPTLSHRLQSHRQGLRNQKLQLLFSSR
jgi:hypothetical protein